MTNSMPSDEIMRNQDSVRALPLQEGHLPPGLLDPQSPSRPPREGLFPTRSRGTSRLWRTTHTSLGLPPWRLCSPTALHNSGPPRSIPAGRPSLLPLCFLTEVSLEAETRSWTLHYGHEGSLEPSGPYPQTSEFVIVPPLIDEGRLLLAEPDAEDFANDHMVSGDHSGIADPAIEGDEARRQSG